MIEKEIKARKFAAFKDQSLYYIVFDDIVKMEPFVRTEEVMFEATATNATNKNKYIATINAQVYGMNTAGYMDYAVGNDPVTPSGIEPEGYTILSGKILAGRAAPLNFYIANFRSNAKKFAFCFGAAPVHAGAAIGGAGPIIINGLPYGTINHYIEGKPQGKSIGQPSPENAKNLTQRSNATFTEFTKHDASPKTGITAIAYHSKKKKLAIMVHPDLSDSMPLTNLRNKLLKAHFDNANFLDGSNSSMLMINGKFYARQGLSKNKTNVVGIGFKYSFT